eukprot:CAMPEP_0116106060 /NCGR_PEP_ID=MMETSP0327-20121206/15421_1 /TAXON_ID=44447 /ORGANISM="Pseudo-nitzschia delicatissima, Strain B596" /LENGTH=489 /DNA_ID=CAMNT_0003598621 /DNA_START=20 /DNA_END=1489 /DNA_ORIENTATION=+
MSSVVEESFPPSRKESPTDSNKVCGPVLIRVVSFFFLGTCAWSLVNAIFAQLPIILGWGGDWSLASSISLCIALSNVVAFFWEIQADIRNGKPILSTQNAIGILLLFGLAIGLIFSLTDIAEFTQDNGSNLLLTLSTGAGVVGVMSLVLFFPHAYASARLDNGWSITSLGTGTAVANLFLAAMAIVQGPGMEEPRFSMQAYFGICVAFFGMAFLGWYGTIVFKPKVDTPEPEQEAIDDVYPVEEAIERAEEVTNPGNKTVQEQLNHHMPDIVPNQAPGASGIPLGGLSSGGDVVLEFYGQEAVTQGRKIHLAFQNVLWPIASDPRFMEAMLVQLLLNALTFFLPGVAPFSVYHFPNPNHALQYLTISQLVAQTIGITMTGIERLRSEKLYALLVVSSLVWIPLVVLSVVNNTSNFHSLQQNAALPITLNAIFNLLYGYLSTTCFQVVGSRCKDGENGEHVTRVLGFLNQVGSMTGSIVGYLVVTKGELS